MDDLVAVKVTLIDGGVRYFLTWGRIQERIDSGPLEELVLRHASSYVEAVPVSATLCQQLREAAESSNAPYFFECFFRFCGEQIPFGDEYAEWRKLKAASMDQGRDLAYCGAPS